MRQSTSLEKLHEAFDYRVARLSSIIAVPYSDPDYDRRIAYAVVESLSAWAAFAREFYLSCAWLRAKTISGSLAEPAAGPLASEFDALYFAVATLRPPQVLQRVQLTNAISPREEPTWHEVSTLLRLNAALAFSNGVQFTQAFSYPTRFFQDAPPVRNFFAHRNQMAAEKVRRLAFSQPYNARIHVPHHFLGRLLPGRAQTLMEEWLDDIRLVSYELCY